MKIGFDVSQTSGEKTGCGYFSQGLIEKLAQFDHKNEYTLYSTFGDHYWCHSHKNTFKVKLPNFKKGLSHKNLNTAKSFWAKNVNDIETQLGSVNILHSNNFFCPPKLPNTKLIYTLYDLSFLEHPEATTEHNRIACFDSVFKASVTADFIIAISEYSKIHFINTFPHYPKAQITVIHPGNRLIKKTNLIQPKNLMYLETQKFWLNVGTLEPRKNIMRLLLAYKKLVEHVPNAHPLVLAGKLGWLEKNIETTIKNMGLSRKVHLLGYINNEALQWLYQNCFCFIYPSLFEGFGLPVLEAMNMGAPVITSHTSSLPEVVGSAGILVNPLDERDILEAMLQLSENNALREDLRNKSLKQATLFSWEKTALETMKIYEQVANMTKG